VRLFVSVPLPAAQREDLLRALGGGRPTNPEQWHLTLAFLGDRDDDVQLVDALAVVADAHAPFALHLAGAGHFPGVEWAGVAGDLPALARLAEEVAAACRVQRAAFRPHVTIARRGRTRLRPDYVGPSWVVTGFDLVESRLVRPVEHHLVARFELTASPPEGDGC
jgi:2'-5' RNA ligase